MKVIVGTTNKNKIESLRVSLEGFGYSCTVEGFGAESGVSETPLNEETKTGALNRVLNTRAGNPDYDMYVGIESGLENRHGDLFEEVWVVILYKGKTYFAYSSGIILPEVVSKVLDPDVKNHPEVMQELRKQNNLTVDEFGLDTWGEYTGGVIHRSVGLKEAVRNTLVQIFPGEGSFYK